MTNQLRLYGGSDAPLGDNDVDALGFEPYVAALADFILNCDTPMTVAIQGDWGSGKTSLMNLIRAKLPTQDSGGRSAEAGSDKQKRIRALWINTWQFSQFELGGDLPFSLISLFTKEIAGNDSSSFKQGVLSALPLLRNVTRGIALAGVALVAGKDVAESLATGTDGVLTSDPAALISKLRTDLESLVGKSKRDSGIDRFVIFVDDIDRLVPVRAVELLEVLKVFLDIPGCVFVLACDYHVISQGLRAKFGADSSDLRGKHFFDKIIQLPFSMPVGHLQVTTYLRNLLEGCDIHVAFDDHRQMRRYENLIAASVGFNPRGLKRLTNCLKILRLVAEKKQLFPKAEGRERQSDRDVALVAALCMQTAFEPVYLALVEISQQTDDALVEALNYLRDPSVGQGAPTAILTTITAQIEAAVALMGRNSEDARRALSRFASALYDAIQIDGGDVTLLEPEEAAVFATTLRFSAITATAPPVIVRGRLDVSTATNQLSRVKQTLEPALEDKSWILRILEDDGDVWLEASIPRFGFRPYLGFKANGELWISVDVCAEGRNESGARSLAKEWCGQFLTDRDPRTEIRKSNASTGVVRLRLMEATEGLRTLEAPDMMATSDGVNLFTVLLLHVAERRVLLRST